jgi:hypothetical protein
LQAGDIQLAAIGINYDVSHYYDVSRYYELSATASTADDLDSVVLQLIEQLLCPPQEDVGSSASTGANGREPSPD